MPKVVITQESLPEILHLIETWEGKLTWPLLCTKVMHMLGIEGGVTRQALSSYKEIQETYTARKEILRHAPSVKPVIDDAYVSYLQNQVVSLQAELKAARVLNERYKHRFIKWQHNAYKYNLGVESLDDVLDMLEEPLIEIKRRTGGG
ncbi:hypothetical protein AB9R84_01400 [Oceanimonas smirnovii]|uniref:hypothetical protein n=1 Tax=Oceanimonas smirnovii TaxID=264574 RepID=UPI003AAD8B67